MRVLVIGGAGFVGSHLVERLLVEGHAVDVVDDLSTGSIGNLADARADAQRSDGRVGELKIHHLDARSADLSSLVGMRAPDVLYHLALFPRHDRSDVAQAAGFGAAMSALDAARRHGIGKVVVLLPASSLFGHPAARDLPLKEGPLVPRGVRGVAARAVVDLLVEHRERHSIEFTALASSSIYGPRQRPDGGVVAAFHAAATAGVAGVVDGGGRQSRDFLFVDDAVDACARAIDRGGGLVVNIGTGQQTAVVDVWRAVASGRAPAEPVVGPARPDDLARFAVSPVRARIHLAWSPWTDLANGLARLG
jgi:UDP-glucose 4-epimerase